MRSRRGPNALDDLSGVKVLVVDDAVDTLDVLEQILKVSGAATLTASSANRALDLIRRERPDVIVSDIGMPDVDGFELMRSVRRRAAEEGGATPSIALTAFTREDDRNRALQAGYTTTWPSRSTPAPWSPASPAWPASATSS
jgi:CheY-like chemotaxis protein